MDRDFKGVWIPREIWLNTELSMLEKVLLIEIDSLDTENHCTAGNDYFAQFCNCGVATITRAITHLKDLGYIEELDYNGRVRKLRLIKMISQTNQNDEELNISISNNTNNNTNKQNMLLEDNEDANYNIREKSKKIKWFVEQYNSICHSLPKCTRLTDRRRKAILKTLSNFTEEEILQVLTNLEASDFCKGKNDRGWKANIDFVLREDKFVAALEGRYNSKSRGCNVEAISDKGAPRKQVSKEEKEEMRRLVELGELEEY